MTVTSLTRYARLFPFAPPPAAYSAIADVLDRYPAHLVELLIERRIKIHPLEAGSRYLDASAALRRLRVDVDAWPVAPAGLFLVEERTVYLRGLTRMTISHELGHAIDCALGGGIYRSSFDPKLRSAFAAARDFVTPYAASGLDEYFAEGQRAYVEMNDERSPWPRVSRERLRAVDPALYEFTAEVFDEDAAPERPRRVRPKRQAARAAPTNVPRRVRPGAAFASPSSTSGD